MPSYDLTMFSDSHILVAALQQDESPNFCVAATTDPGHGPTRSRRGFLVSSQRSSAAGLSEGRFWWNAAGRGGDDYMERYYMVYTVYMCVYTV